jgi:hypothetical protein
MIVPVRSVLAIVAPLATSCVLALGCGGSSNGCDEHHPYACEQQKHAEERASDLKFQEKVARLVEAKRKVGTCPQGSSSAPVNQIPNYDPCRMAVLLELQYGG